MVRFLGLALLALTSCNKIENITEFFDTTSFEYTGGTLFKNPKRMTMKQIHLEKDGLVGKEVIVEGNILELGRFLTYAVLSDHTARMLIVLTDVDSKDTLNQPTSNANTLRILGSVENGKKGLPYILVKALKNVEARPGSEKI